MTPLGKTRLRALLKGKGVNMKEASLGAGLGATYVRDLLEKDRGGRARELAKLSAFLNVSIEYLMGDVNAAPETAVPPPADDDAVKVVGRVGAGIWFEVDATYDLEGFKPSMLPPDDRYDAAAQFDLEIIGSSLDRIAREGEFLRCVDFDKAGMSPQSGDLVIVFRTRDGAPMFERTAKFYHRLEGRVELRPCSNDKRWQQAVVITDDEEHPDAIEVKALVLYAYRPIGRSRA